jgi:hypothetical protein
LSERKGLDDEAMQGVSQPYDDLGSAAGAVRPSRPSRPDTGRGKGALPTVPEVHHQAPATAAIRKAWHAVARVTLESGLYFFVAVQHYALNRSCNPVARVPSRAKGSPMTPPARQPADREHARLRQQRRRRRLRDGKRRIVILIDESLIEDGLLARGLLAPQDVDDAAAVAAAARDALTEWAEMQIAPPPEPDVESRVTSRLFDFCETASMPSARRS